MYLSRNKIKKIIREELEIYLFSPDEHLVDQEDEYNLLRVDPPSVEDSWFPSDVVAREDSWAGGDNLEDDLDHAHFETGESNAGPHNSISWSHDPDSLTPGEAAGVGYAACRSELDPREEWLEI
jgi:hypothetical protein